MATVSRRQHLMSDDRLRRLLGDDEQAKTEMAALFGLIYWSMQPNGLQALADMVRPHHSAGTLDRSRVDQVLADARGVQAILVKGGEMPAITVPATVEELLSAASNQAL